MNLSLTETELEILIEAMDQLEYYRRGNLSPEEQALFLKLKSLLAAKTHRNGT